MKIRHNILFFILIAISCGVTNGISENKAKKIAERYLIEQGWANKRLDKNSTEIDIKGLKLNGSIDEHLNLRYNTLIPKAVYSKKKDDFWIIGFRYNQNQNGIKNTDKNIGRAVKVSLNGTECHMIWEMYDLTK
ncbi:hypothetical protein [uncultured Psychroserpens sp.]|uniref:hypothetical protein n=1 Tax=uncultured Psychroserpens sp. TaxID=255436 RepID=UPI00260B7CAE|nr:hypothetical protein [uncultured Psychroserpens sp.]